MAIQTFIRYYVGSIVMVAVSQAMFFTDSKENDYPRIGKRPQTRPLEHVTRWLDRDARAGARDSYVKHAEKPELEDLSSELFSNYGDVIREALGSVNTLSTKTPEKNEDRILLKLLLSYIDHNRDVNL